MSKTDLLRSLSEQRVRQTVDRQVGPGMVANLFEDNPFASHFDTVEYQDSQFREYETLADPETQKKPIRDIKDIAARSNPHFKAAMTDFQDYVVGGWKFNPAPTPVIDKFLDSMENSYEGFDSYLSDITDSLFLHAAFFHESVFNEEMELVRFIALDPKTAEFRQRRGEHGQYYELFQRKSWPEPPVILQDNPTTFYRRLYSKPNYPYGVPFVDSGIFHMVMMVEFFKSYKALLDSFVMPNLFFTVDREVVQAVVTDPTQRKGFVEEVFKRLVDQIKKRTGAGRVITMGSEVSEPFILSGMNEKTMGAGEALINALDNQLELALKTHGLTTLRNDSALNDTKAKYRMANYSRVIKRSQRVITTPVNYQFALAHFEAGTRGSPDFILERSIFEDEQIKAEISSVISTSNKNRYDAMGSLLEVLDIAVEKGRMTDQQADAMFIDEVSKMESQNILADPLE